MDRREFIKGIAYSSIAGKFLCANKTNANTHTQPPIIYDFDDDISKLNKSVNEAYLKQATSPVVIQWIDSSGNLNITPTSNFDSFRNDERPEDIAVVALLSNYDFLGTVSRSTSIINLFHFYPDLTLSSRYNNIDSFFYNLIGAQILKVRSIKYKDNNDGALHHELFIWGDINTEIYKIEIDKSRPAPQFIYKGKITSKLEERLKYPSDIQIFDNSVFWKKTNGLCDKYPLSIFSALNNDSAIPEPIEENTRLEDRLNHPSLVTSPIKSIFSLNKTLFGLRDLNDFNKIDQQVAKDIIKLNFASAEWAYFHQYFGHRGVLRWELPLKIYVDPSINKRNVEVSMKYLYLTSGINYEMVNYEQEPGILVRTIRPEDRSRFGPNFTASDLERIGGFAQILKTSNNRITKGLVAIKSDRAQDVVNDIKIHTYRHEMEHIIGLINHIKEGPGLTSESVPTFNIIQREIDFNRYLYLIDFGYYPNSDGTLIT